ncbi:MAG TPA: DinB family protein [Candidatus Binataceae bacterium]|nr:DinB family protein [Candidatus Binataceae bacterium]
MEQNLPRTIALLSRTPPTLDALLRDLPDDWIKANEGEGTFSAFDVVAHLIHAEQEDWMPRVRMILQHGEAQVFDPFDRWATVRESRNRPLGSLLDEFAQLRAASLGSIRALNLSSDRMNATGRHPSFGRVTLSQLLATWAVHDLTHLHQISRVMAHQYCDAVGPWINYLGVLLCNGHST